MFPTTMVSLLCGTCPCHSLTLQKRSGSHFQNFELNQKLHALIEAHKDTIPSAAHSVRLQAKDKIPIRDPSDAEDRPRTPPVKELFWEDRAVPGNAPDRLENCLGVSPPPPADAEEATCIEQLSFCQQTGLFRRTCRTLFSAYLPIQIYKRWYPVMTKLSINLMVEIIHAFYPEYWVTLATTRDDPNSLQSRHLSHLFQSRHALVPHSSPCKPPLTNYDDDGTVEP